MNNNSVCNCCPSAVSQSLEELDFCRGIWSAAVDGDLEKVQRFLKLGKDPNMQDSSGYTALHYAARNGRLLVCQYLLQFGANPNIRTKSGSTPLHRAVFQGHQDIVDMLLKYKANVLLSDDNGKTVLHKAFEGNQFSIAAKLLNSFPEFCDLINKQKHIFQKIAANEKFQNLLQQYMT